MDEQELAEIEKEVSSWIFSRRTVGEHLIAEVRRLNAEVEKARNPSGLTKEEVAESYRQWIIGNGGMN